MQKRKSKKIFIYFFLLIIFGSITNINLNNIELYKIKDVEVSGMNEFDNKAVLENILKLNLGNIFFLNKFEIVKVLNSKNSIEEYQIFKKYPSELEIKIEKTKFLAKINIDGKLFFVGSNGKLSKKKITNLDLPYIFGKPQIKEFLKFKYVLDMSSINYNEIKNLYFYQSKRWDLELKNNIIFKLPENVSVESINNILVFLNDNNLENIKVIDLRVHNQIITNDR